MMANARIEMTVRRLLNGALCVVCLCLALVRMATARGTSCQAQFVNQAPPAAVSPMLDNRHTHQLCLRGFTVGYSEVLNSPLWSAEYLTRERLEAARQLPRDDFFHVELQLKSGTRAELEDFKGSGYDRGHLAPNFDMPTLEAQYDSFSLANIVPQNSQHNRNLWADVERLTRYQVYKYDVAYVVTGAVFLQPMQFLDSGLVVPSHLYKAVYVPELGQAGVYWSSNDTSAHLEVISLAELAKRTGVSAMPSLPDKVQQYALYLPTDTDDPEADINLDPAIETTQSWWKILVDFFVQLSKIIERLFTQ